MGRLACQPERATLRSYICISNRSKLRVERTKKSLARNSRVLRVQVLCCLYTDDCNDSERECARKMNEKSLHLNANGAFLPSIQATIGKRIRDAALSIFFYLFTFAA